MKISTTFLVVFSLCFMRLNAQKNKTIYDKTQADSAWAKLPVTPKGSFAEGREKSLELFMSIEKFRLSYREEGLKFWNNFPNDSRKYLWLINTLAINQPQYWLDLNYGAKLAVQEMYDHKYAPIPRNEQLMQKWNFIYPKLKDEFINSSKISNDQKVAFKVAQLSAFLRNPYAYQEKLRLDSLYSLFLSSCEAAYHDETSIKKSFQAHPLSVIEILFRDYTNFKLSQEDLISFTSLFLDSEIPILKLWAKQKISIYQLKVKPFQFAAKSIDGKNLNLKDYKGKVVLMDFWATSCSSCISWMKTIKPIYDQYKNKGFEILSISIDTEDRMKEVQKVKDRIQADWPTAVIGGKSRSDRSESLGNQIWGKFGFESVPQYFLFDKNGLLYEYNGILSLGDIEPIINKLLIQ